MGGIVNFIQLHVQFNGDVHLLNTRNRVYRYVYYADNINGLFVFVANQIQ